MNGNPGWDIGVNWLLSHSWQAGLLVLLVLAVQLIFRRRLTNRWRFALWWIVLARLLLPFNPTSEVSLFNFLSPNIRLETPRAATAPQVHPDVQTTSTTSPLEGTPAVQNDAASVPVTPAPANIVPQETSVAVMVPAASQATHPQSIQFREYAKPVMLGIWMTGMFAFTSVIIFQVLRFRRKLAHHTAPAEARLQQLFADCQREFACSRRIELLETDAVQSPALFGLLRLRLLLPRGTGDQFSDRELRYIFLH